MLEGVNTRQMMVIFGLGGIGKTQIVRRFIKNNQSTYKNVIWINAERSDTISESFKKLATDRLNILTTHPNGQPKDIISVIEEAFTKLCKRKTLFVYDNVDEIDNISFLLTIATSEEKPNVVITSRIQEWGDEIDVIHLKAWKLDEAIDYVSITLKSKDSDDEKKLLVETLQAFPLALRQATAHINYQRKVEIFQITEYIAKYHTLDMLNSKFFTKVVGNLYEQTTFTTWKITIDTIKRDSVNGQLAVRILNIIAYFDPENIHRDIFDHLKHEQNEMDGDIKSALRLLVNYSMVDSHDEIQTVLSAHRLVQKVIQLNLQDMNQEKPILQDALELISELIRANRKIVDVGLPHAMSVFLSALKITELIEAFSILASQILWHSIDRIKYNQAKAFSDKIEQPLMSILGENHANMLETRFYIGRLNSRLGLHNEALKVFNDIYDKEKIILGEDHSNTLGTRSSIALSYTELGKHSEAFQIFEDVYNKQKIIAGDDHRDTLASRSNIASALRELGRHSEALEIFENVYDRQKIIFGEDHPYTLGTRSHIAISYTELGKHSEALQIYEAIYNKQKIILGDDHPETLANRSNIASSHTYLGQHSEALQIYEDVYYKLKIFLGDDHPSILINISNIASSLRALGNHYIPLRIYEGVYEKRREVLGENHPETLKTRCDIAFSHRELGRHTIALQIFEDVYHRQKNILGEDHPSTLSTKSHIAFCRRELEKYSETSNL